MFLDNVLAMDTRRDKKPLVFLRLDMWHLKSVNDEYGFEVGDAVIVAAYDLFKAGLAMHTPDYAVARSHGDEFMACFPGDAGLADKIAASVAEAFAAFDTKPIGISQGIGCYIGGVIATGDAVTLRQRMSDTYEALEESRKKGRNAYTIF